MIFLGTPSSEPIRQAMRDQDIGCIISPEQGGQAPPGAIWAADNGCGPKPDGTPGTGYPGDTAYLSFLLQANGRVLNREAVDPDGAEATWGGFESRCLFATAPDVPYDAEATLRRADLPVRLLYVIRHVVGVPAAFVAQDGMRVRDVPWDDFQVLFIGGSTGWKLSDDARQLTRHAQARGMWVHLGRVNTKQRLRFAAAEGYDSCDGTTLAIAPDINLALMLRWLAEIQRQPALW